MLTRFDSSTPVQVNSRGEGLGDAMLRVAMATVIRRIETSSSTRAVILNTSLDVKTLEVKKNLKKKQMMRLSDTFW